MTKPRKSLLSPYVLKVPGIGKNRLNQLAEKFPTIDHLRAATTSEISAVIKHAPLADLLRRYLDRPEGDESEEFAGVRHVCVRNKTTGFLIKGCIAPQEKGLDAWLAANPEFEASARAAPRAARGHISDPRPGCGILTRLNRAPRACCAHAGVHAGTPRVKARRDHHVRRRL
jgi:hypothetical protein